MQDKYDDINTPMQFITVKPADHPDEPTQKDFVNWAKWLYTRYHRPPTYREFVTRNRRDKILINRQQGKTIHLIF